MRRPLSNCYLSGMRNFDVASEQTFVTEFARLYRIFRKTHQTSRSFFGASAAKQFLPPRVFRDRRDFVDTYAAARVACTDPLYLKRGRHAVYGFFQRFALISSLPFPRKGGVPDGPCGGVQGQVVRSGAMMGENDRVASCNSKLFQ